MNVKNYSTLKAASKVSFAKAIVDDEEVIQLTEKTFDSSTGEALSNKVQEVQLHEYESQKSALEIENTVLETTIAELAKIITDIKAL